jgi:hypothetical protein
MSNNKLYTPTEVESTERLVLLGFAAKACPICQKTMVDAPEQYLKYCQTNRGAAFDGGNTMEAQLKRGGYVFRSDAEDKDGNTICRSCKDEGRSSFVCYHCKKEHPTNKIEERYGDPAEYLCTDCYTSVPAKEWDELTTKLSNAHRYDWD